MRELQLFGHMQLAMSLGLWSGRGRPPRKQTARGTARQCSSVVQQRLSLPHCKVQHDEELAPRTARLHNRGRK